MSLIPYKRLFKETWNEYKLRDVLLKKYNINDSDFIFDRGPYHNIALTFLVKDIKKVKKFMRDFGFEQPIHIKDKKFTIFI